MGRIETSFIITTNKIPINDIAEQIGIEPFYVRTTFPNNSIAEPFWYVEVSSDSCCIEEPLTKLASVLEHSKSEIADVLRKTETIPTVLVVINSDYEDRPEITFSPTALAFFAQFDAEICIEVNS